VVADAVAETAAAVEVAAVGSAVASGLGMLEIPLHSNHYCC